MPGSKQLTLNQKAKWTPIIIDRDFPNGQTHLCFYCCQEFIENDPQYCKEWEHLNNDEQDNRPENLVWAHARCNELKKKNADWQILAHDKLKKNVRFHSESLGGREGGGSSTAHTQIQPNEQIDANADAAIEAEKFLTERLLPFLGKLPLEERIDFSDAADTIAFRCYKKHGHGSQNTITRILKMLTCGDAPFEKVKQDGRTWIRRRTGN